MNYQSIKSTLINSSLLIFFTLNACQQKMDNDSPLHVVDLKKSYEDVTVQLEDFADDIRLVRLESNDDILLRHFGGFIGDKHIISMDHEKVLQFSADGEFICVIANRGQGPGEFNQIDAWDVDDEEQYFYYHDKTKDHIKKYNLNSLGHEVDIPFPDKGDLSGMISVNDTLLAILPGKFSEYGYLYFYQSESGKIIGGKEKKPVPHPGAWAGRSDVFTKGTAGNVIFQPSESDTVYQIAVAGMEPLFRLAVEEPEKNGYKTKGFHASFIHENGHRRFLAKTAFNSEVTPSFASMSILDVEYYLYNTAGHNAERIESFTYNYNGLNLKAPFLRFKDDRFFIQYYAHTFKKLIDDALKKGEVSEDKIMPLQQLSSEISENDNPILVTGKFRVE